MGQQLAIDVGAVYLRVVVLLPGPPDESLTGLICFYSPLAEGTYYLLKFLPETLESFKDHPIYARLSPSQRPVYITGIGGKQVKQRIESYYEVRLLSTPNTPCLIKGLEYMQINHPETFFFFPGSNFSQISSIGRFNDVTAAKTNGLSEGDFYPCLLLNLRSGLSIYRLDSPTQYRRIQGSCLGGTTIWSILKILTSFKSPEEAVRASVEGDNTLIDMSVGDIYGCTYDQAGLNREIIASSCAKLRFTENPAPQDLAKSLFGMFILNFTQITWLISEAENVGKIVVTGNMITVPGLMDAAQACMNFWSKGTKQLLFNEYSFYLGALGELIS
jgi:type II pantothenate kinase